MRVHRFDSVDVKNKSQYICKETNNVSTTKALEWMAWDDLICWTIFGRESSKNGIWTNLNKQQQEIHKKWPYLIIYLPSRNLNRKRSPRFCYSDRHQCFMVSSLTLGLPQKKFNKNCSHHRLTSLNRMNIFTVYRPWWQWFRKKPLITLCYFESERYIAISVH